MSTPLASVTNSVNNTTNKLSGNSPANPIEAFKGLQDRGQAFVQSIVDDCKNQPPKEWGIYFGLSFLLMLLGIIGTRGSEDPVLSFGLFFFALIVTVSSVIIRRQDLAIQYPIAVTVMSFARIFADFGAFSILFFALVPVIVNYARSHVKI